LRIISGKYGGRKLSHFKADHLRPTTDRIKETIFNKLQHLIEDARVLDLFSGTGNLGLEALSRGASSVTSVDDSAKSMMILKKNKSLLSVGDELQAIQQDIFRFLKQNQQQYDIIFVDPPFTKKMGHDVLTAISQSKIFNKESQLFIETTNQETVMSDYAPLHEKSKKSYGDKHLSHYIVKFSDDTL
jgi:16S rRNA (guanine966-N2)-methyltransferase